MRRGGERYLNDLAWYLAGAGHHVTVRERVEALLGELAAPGFLAGLVQGPLTAWLVGIAIALQIVAAVAISVGLTLLFGAVITGIGYLQFFEEPFVMTRGGPLSSTLSVSYHIYNQFGFGNYGYTAATAFVLFIAVADVAW